MKLKVTENVIDKKDAVVEGVNKIVERKERRVHYTQKQRDEQIAFGKKGAKKWKIKLKHSIIIISFIYTSLILENNFRLLWPAIIYFLNQTTYMT